MKARLKNIYKLFLFKLLFPLYYRLFALRPVQPGKALFIEIRSPELTHNLRLLHDAFCARPGHSVQLAFLLQDRGSKGGYVLRCLRMLRAAATAAYIVLDDSSNVLSAVPLRRQTRVLQAFHACGAFKRFSYSTADKPYGSDGRALSRFPTHRHYTLVPVSSPEVVWAFEEAMNLGKTPGIVQPLGVSRTDYFFNEAFVQSARARVEAAIPAARGRKILLYAPTFRGEVAHAAAPDRLEPEVLAQALSGEWLLLIKQHPLAQNRPAVPSSLSHFALDISDTLDVETLLCASDACITDYSSLVFEYALLERPLLFFAYDLEDYYDQRGFYYPYEEMAPGPICRTTRELADALTAVSRRFDPQAVSAFRKKFMSACDGRATDRIMRVFTGEGDE